MVVGAQGVVEVIGAAAYAHFERLAIVGHFIEVAIYRCPADRRVFVLHGLIHLVGGGVAAMEFGELPRDDFLLNGVALRYGDLLSVCLILYAN